MKKNTMRGSKIKVFIRILDTVSSVLSVLALLLIYHRITDSDFSRVNNLEWRGTPRDFEASSSLLNDPESDVDGKLVVQVWPNICGGKLSNLFNSPFFPRFSEKSYFISETRASLNTRNYGQRVVGYLRPKETGYYKFVLYSDDGSEFWFGSNESIASLKLAASVASRDRIGSAPVGEIRYDSQITEDFLLEKGNKYALEIIHLQGTEADFVELHWIRPGKHYLEIITSEYISHSLNFESTSRTAISKFKQSHSSVPITTKFYLVAFLTEGTVKKTLPTCSFTLPVSTKPKVPRFQAYKEVKEIAIVTNEKDANWSANKEARKIVDLFMAGLEKIFPKKYNIAKLYNLERIPLEDETNSALYLLELKLGCDALDYTERVTEYVHLQNKGEDSLAKGAPLCYPRDLGWNKEAVVHLILAVNHEGQRLLRFIEKLEQIFKENLEVDFHLLIIHSGKSGIDIGRVLQGTLLGKYMVKQYKDEEFSWTRAINYGIRLISDPGHIVLTTNVHMDLPASIFDDCRKHCIEGKMTFAPVQYALECGAYPDKPKGSWRSHGYQMIGMYKSDWDRIGGLDESVRDEQAAWDLVDRILSSGLHIARVKTPNLFRLFYPESRDFQEPTSVHKASGFYKEDA